MVISVDTMISFLEKKGVFGARADVKQACYDLKDYGNRMTHDDLDDITQSEKPGLFGAVNILVDFVLSEIGEDKYAMMRDTLEVA